MTKTRLRRKSEQRNAPAAVAAPAAAAQAVAEPAGAGAAASAMAAGELRSISGSRVEVRAGRTGAPIISGLIPYNSESVEMWGMREVILPGAFTKSLASGDVRALVGHDDSKVLGRVSAGTLSFDDGADGLRFSVQPPDTSFARDLLESIRRKDITGASFRFRTITDRWRKQDGLDYRELVEVELIEVSPVAFPAYPGSEAGLRSLGWDLKIIAECVVRAQAGAELSEEERKVLGRAINVLSGLLKPGERQQSAAPAAPEHDRLRAWCDVAELEP